MLPNEMDRAHRWKLAPESQHEPSNCHCATTMSSKTIKKSSNDRSRCLNNRKIRNSSSRESLSISSLDIDVSQETPLGLFTESCESSRVSINNQFDDKDSYRRISSLRKKRESSYTSDEIFSSNRVSLASSKNADYNVRWTKECTPINICLFGRNSWQLVSFIIIVVVALTDICSANTNQCAPGLTTPGRTWPQGDIVLEYGQSLKILCMLNKTFIEKPFPGKNSSDLVFFRNEKEIDPEFISIVNDTTISMYVEKPPPAEDMYYCKLKLNDGFPKPHEAVCLNKVVIGFKPEEPKNFSCISQNWENMMCSWDPVPNYITTQFTLVFKLPGRAGGRKLFPCPDKDDKIILPPNTCMWDTTTNPIYRQPYEIYTFIMTVTNVLGNDSFTYKIHHYANVIPAKPANLSVVNKTSDSALLHWSAPFPMQNFPPGLHHRVAYQHQWDPQKSWRVINITNDIHTYKRYYNLTKLEYANSVYDVRVFMKSAVARGEDRWSEFSVVAFRTPSRLPGLPPRIDIGSFEIAENNANRDVYLYWQAIPPYLENGDNFKYQIAHVEENGRKLFLLPNETTRTYAKFKGISFNSYRFEIVTTNVVGANPERAQIFVPSQIDLPHEPLAFTKIAFDGGLYELSWKPPVNSDDVTNYTIFWCDNERDRPYQCTGYLDWVHVSKNTTIHNMTVPDAKKVYQFAISANTARASSGMVWASCTVIHNKVVGKMKSVWINRIGSDFIEVGWKLDCSDRIDIVEGFNISYCPIVSPYVLKCKGPKLNTTIRADPHTIHGIVYGLKPYTTYMLAVAVLTKSGSGPESDPLYNTTLEAAPTTPPQQVTVTNVTNSTMLVSWKPPAAMNGVLRYYEVHYNTHEKRVEEEEANHYLLKDLIAHWNYSVSVTACTISCSVRSPAILVTTAIGTPGKIGKIPNVRFMNSSQVMVRWSMPNNNAGLLDYYQIWSADGEIRNSTSTEAYIPISDCKTVGREKMYQFRVRAVNIALDGSHLEGPWSEPGEGNCYSHGPSYKVWVIIWVISSCSVLAFLFCVGYTSTRMWLKCKSMRDVGVDLPPGLTPTMKLIHKVGEHHIRQSSADSSGCSSGQESVTSSLTSNSHVSSDSGADVDPLDPPVKLLDNAPPSWESSSLRQRNVGNAATKPIGASATVTTAQTDSPRWESYVKVGKSGEPMLDDKLSLARSTPNLTDNVIATGGCYTASPQAWSSTGYISMPSSEELSSNPSPVPKSDSISSELYNLHVELPEISEPKPTMPYVSLASLEQKNREQKPRKDNLEDLERIPESVESSIPSASYDWNVSIFDALKKPFSPFVDVNQTLHQPKTLFPSTTKAPISTFANPQTFSNKLGESKPYVTVASLPVLTGKAKLEAQSANNSPTVPNLKLPTWQDSTEALGKNLPPGYSHCWIPEETFELVEPTENEQRNLSPGYSRCCKPDEKSERDETTVKGALVETEELIKKQLPPPGYSVILGKSNDIFESNDAEELTKMLSPGYSLVSKNDDKNIERTEPSYEAQSKNLPTGYSRCWMPEDNSQRGESVTIKNLPPGYSVLGTKRDDKSEPVIGTATTALRESERLQALQNFEQLENVALCEKSHEPHKSIGATTQVQRPENKLSQTSVTDEQYTKVGVTLNSKQ